MKKLFHKQSEEQNKLAHGMVRRIASKPITIICVIVVVLLLAIYGYYRTHQKAVLQGTVTVTKSQPGRVGDLTITLTDVTFQSEPPTYSVTAKVLFDNGLPEMQIRKASEGYIVTYPKEHGYRIELLKADSVSAKFSIRKNP